ncbi:MAG: hypothetical protein H6589_09955 [Flavobacteriales bacterium]|nr:hypothetical protein [Flavobacteriales bacterium]
MKLVIQLVLIVASAFMGYLIYDSINSKIELEKEVKHRKAVVIERLEQIKEAQISYKKVRGEYAKSFDQLRDFLENDSLIVVKAIGVVPDSLLGQEAKALAMGIIVRDTSKIAVRNEMFKENFQQVVDSLSIIPFSGGSNFSINSGEVEKGKVKVKVFEVTAPYKEIFKGLKTDNEGIDMNQALILGSMTEPSINGNWD